MAKARSKAAKRGPRTDAEARKARALPLVILGVPYRDVAKEVGVTAATVERWVREDPRFRHALETATKASDEVLAKIRDELARGAFGALQTLVTAAMTDWQAAARLLALIGVSAPKRLEHDLAPGRPDLLDRVGEILAKRQGRKAAEGDG